MIPGELVDWGVGVQQKYTMHSAHMFHKMSHLYNLKIQMQVYFTRNKTFM